MPYNIIKATELVDYPGPDAQDFLPGICYDGWTARSALSEYMAGELEVWEYEEVLDCLIAEWENPSKKTTSDHNREIVNVHKVPPHIMASASSMDPGPSHPPSNPVDHFQAPFKVHHNPFNREIVIIEYRNLQFNLTRTAFNYLSQDPNQLMKYLESEHQKMTGPHIFDYATWHWDENIGKWAENIPLPELKIEKFWGIP